MSKPLTVWCNASLSDDAEATIRSAISPSTLALASGAQKSNLVAGGSDEACRSADVALGQPDPADIIASTSLKWIHLTSAGYTRYDRDDIRTALKARGAIMTNSSSVYAEPCAQHLLAMMLGVSRQLPQALINQRSERAWPYLAMRKSTFLLKGQSAILVGFGAIASRLVEMLASFEMKLIGVRRTPTGRESIKTHATGEIDSLLADADHVVNILPSAKGNEHFFDAKRFARIKRGAFFYNIGRGDTVDQNALAAALQSGQLRAAYLDVTTPEPLPPDHELWTTENCFITPHSGGGHLEEPGRQVGHFLANWRAFMGGEAPVDRVA